MKGNGIFWRYCYLGSIVYRFFLCVKRSIACHEDFQFKCLPVAAAVTVKIAYTEENEANHNLYHPVYICKMYDSRYTPTKSNIPTYVYLLTDRLPCSG